jgi:hypothetical protein
MPSQAAPKTRRTALLHSALAAALCATACLLLAGCGNAAANTAAVLLGAGVGAQAVTGSNVSVTVEVYQPDGADFTLAHPLAAQRIAESAAVAAADPVDKPTLPVLQQIEAKLTSLLNRMSDNADRLGTQARALEDLAPKAFKDIGGDLDKLVNAQEAVSTAWNQYRRALRVAIRHPTSQATSNAGQSLGNLRAALDALRQRKLSLPSLEFFSGRLGNAIINASRRSQDPTIQADALALGTNVPRAALAAASAAANADEQLHRAFEAAMHVVGDRPWAQAAVQRSAADWGISSDPATTAQIQALLVPGGADESTLREQERTALKPALAMAVQLQRDAGKGVSITFGLLTSSPNLGPITNEVTQFLLTPGKSIGAIADPVNETRWKPFSYCRVNTGPGNNDVVFYMENDGRPILKSAAFDPTKFIVANGKIYQRAFSVLAGAITDDATGAAAASGGGGKGAAKTKNGKGAGKKGGKSSTGEANTGDTTDDTGEIDVTEADTVADDTTSAGDTNGGGGATDDTSANKTPDLKKQIAAIRKAKLDALKAIINADKTVKDVTGTDGKWKPEEKRAPTIKSVRKILDDNSKALKAAAKGTAQ